MKKAIKDVKIGDKVLGTDGKWHKVVDKTEIKIPYKMYKITFSNGYIECSDTHQWNVYVNNNMYTMDAEGIFKDIDWYRGKHIGSVNGPTIVDIEEIEPKPVQCLTTSAKDHQFAVYPSK